MIPIFEIPDKTQPTIPSDDWLWEGRNDRFIKSLYELRIKFRNRTDFMKYVRSLSQDGTRFKDGNRTLHCVPSNELRAASRKLNAIATKNNTTC